MLTPGATKPDEEVPGAGAGPAPGSAAEVDLSVDNTPFQAVASPYSLGCHVSAPFIIASTVEELEATEVSNEVILLRGDIAREQLKPKNFPFYNPDRHKRIIQLLETKKPRAIIAATSRDLEMVGGMYPFPLIEDGDFDIPSVYMTDEEGNRLAEHAGKEISLHSRANRIPAQGCNVIARKGANPNRRVVLFAHIDARIGTPGANDNASRGKRAGNSPLELAGVKNAPSLKEVLARLFGSQPAGQPA
jgi:aminopeptidase YwaD